MALYEFFTAANDFRPNLPVLPVDVDGAGLINTVCILNGAINEFEQHEGFPFIRSSFAFSDLSVYL